MTDNDPPPASERPRRRVWPFTIPIAGIFIAALGTVYFPFVNQPTLWFGMPAIGVWTALCVIAIPLALILVEHAGGYGAIDDARDLALEARTARADKPTVSGGTE